MESYEECERMQPTPLLSVNVLHEASNVFTQVLIELDVGQLECHWQRNFFLRKALYRDEKGV